ncbi:hypothetical protein EV176_005077, partial [Coemansia sp. RSA 451]
MRPIDTKAPADTRACLRYWPVGSALSLDVGLQTQYEGADSIDLALESGFDQLSLADSDPVFGGIHCLIRDTFYSDTVQK